MQYSSTQAEVWLSSGSRQAVVRQSVVRQSLCSHHEDMNLPDLSFIAQPMKMKAFSVLYSLFSNRKHISGLVMNGNAWADATCIQCWSVRQIALQPMLPMLIQTW